jgi:alpha-beta hydrolase superfamily lysophospholipase
MSIDPAAMNGTPSREPFYFKSANRSLFGWLYTPSADAPAEVGMVVCKAFGYESVCSYRTVRKLVDAAVAGGTPVLRFDYTGTGDSEDLEAGVDQSQAWTADIVAAVAELKRRTGVKQVCLLGLRLGASLAVLAARQTPDVTALALVAPIIDGRRYVKELRTLQLVASLAMQGAPSDDNRAAGGTGTPPGSLEAAGYALYPASIAALSKLNFNTLEAPPARRLLVIDRDDVSSARAWSEAMTGLGAQVDYAAPPGYVGMLMTAPQFAVTPPEVVAMVSRWLEPYRAGGAAVTPPAAPVGRTVPETTMLQIDTPGSDPAACVIERPMWLGKDSALFGIVTEPRASEVRRRAVIFINAGADNHTGASRIHVSLAREWASRGYVALRLDLAGIGDSDTRPGRPDDDVFPPEAMDDLRAVIEFVRSRYGVGDVTLSGICSGAYHSLRAAAVQLPVNRVLMVNPMNFFWDHRKTLQDVQLVDLVRDPGVYRERVRSIKKWRKVFSGEANIWRFATVHFYRVFLSLLPLLRDAARFLHIRLPQDLGWVLKDTDARGVRTVMVFSRGEPGLELMRILGGLPGKRLSNRCRIHIIDGADHTFTRSSPRAQLADILSAELFAPLDPQPLEAVARQVPQHARTARAKADGLHH